MIQIMFALCALFSYHAIIIHTDTYLIPILIVI